MNLHDVLTGPWAITPAMLQEIHAIYARHVRGETADFAAIEARLGKPLGKSEQGYLVDRGVAVIPIEGVIARKMNMFSQVSGGASTELASRDFRQAMEDDGVKAVVQLLNTPGGTVDGTQEHARLVYNARGQKPIITLAQGTMASGGMWIGAAGDEIYLSSETDQVGSIGVVTAHVDVSQAEAQRGIKTTEIYAGKYKRIASGHKPLSDEGRADMQDRVDYLYSVFVRDMAMMRGTTEEDVLTRMADGRIFIGKQAIDAGLADGFATLGEAIDRALALASGAGHSITIRGGHAPKENTMAEKSGAPKTADELKALHPELCEQIRQEGANSVNVEQVRKEAASTERERVLALAGAQFGEEAGKAFAAVVNTGVTLEQLSAIKGSMPPPEKQPASAAMGQMLAAIQAAGAPNVGSGGGAPAGSKDFDVLVAEHMQVAKCGRAAAMQAMTAAHPQAHQAWLAKKQLVN